MDRGACNYFFVNLVKDPEQTEAGGRYRRVRERMNNLCATLAILDCIGASWYLVTGQNEMAQMLIDRAERFLSERGEHCQTKVGGFRDVVVRDD